MDATLTAEQADKILNELIQTHVSILKMMEVILVLQKQIDILGRDVELLKTGAKIH
jgi:hypothetical protein